MGNPEDRSNTGSPFDIRRLRLSQDFVADAPVKKLLTTIPIRKPDRQWFVRVHPEWEFTAAVLEIKDERESYLVIPDLLPELPGEAVAKTLLAATNRQGIFFLWPVRLPSADGRHDAWNRSALVAAATAKRQWVRSVPDMTLGAYQIYVAEAPLPEPEWPDLSFEDVLGIAFRDRIIQTSDHPVIRRLRGEL